MREDSSFYMPAEWAEHERTLISWPVRSSLVWPDNYDEVAGGYAAVIRAVAEFEPVTVLAGDDTAGEARRLCGDGIDCLTVPHNDAWCRDNGPTFLVSADGRRSAVRWQFNAWGGKYAAFDLDNRVAEAVLNHFGVSFYASPLVLEGGSIHTDGDGTLLTTRECLLNKNRNPALSPALIETELKSALGVSKIIWLNRGLFGDETDGHVDNAACFARPGVILMQTCRDPSDPNFEITQENLEILKHETDARGRALRIIEVPQPPARFYRDTRLTLSYLNFYLVNGGVILPVFGGDATETDSEAAAILADAFPGRRVRTVDGMPLVSEGGNVHCVTQQMPAGRN